MNGGIFRKSSLDRVNSPEQLNEYLRVTRPGVWLTLAAVVLLLLGVVIWGAFGSVETRVKAVAVAEDGGVRCYVALADASRVEAGMPVRIDGREGTLGAIEPETVPLGEYLGGGEGRVAFAEASGLADGVYDAEIVVESLHPITFVIQ